MDFLTEHTDFSREAREEREDNIGSLFLWSVVIVVLLGLNAFSWIFCMYVFGNPEVPFNYQLLSKLDKLDPITGFEPVTFSMASIMSRSRLIPGKTMTADFMGDPIRPVRCRSSRSRCSRSASRTWP